MARLVLVGLPGAGKSTVARSLATTLACEAVDTDELIATSVGCAAGEYLRREGERAFRVRELAALKEALGRDAVVSTGGGVVTSLEARELLRDQMTIWLDGDDDVLVERLADGDRPLLGADVKGDLERLRAQRAAWYDEVSIARVITDGPLETSTRDVLNAMGVSP